MTYHNPESFWLLLPLILVAGWFWYRRSQKQASLLFSELSILKKIPKTFRTRLIFLPTALKYFAILLAIFALARPQRSDTTIKKNVEGMDIMIALDISDSMLIEDMKPVNRLESAKETLKSFVKKRVSDRIGVVIFAGESFTLIPLTLDYEMLLSRIEEIKTAQVARIKDGTAIGVAMANAAGKLKESTAKTRLMIFMTDGENNSGTIDPLTGLEIAKGYGIKVYSIGIGRDGPTKIPIYQKDVFGNTVKTYQPFESTVNENLLAKMASDTGGKYYRASKEDSLAGVFSEIDKLEKTKIDVNKYTRYTELFKNYLLPALMIYLFGIFLSHSWLRRQP